MRALSSLTCRRRLGKCRRVEVVSRCLRPRATEFLYSRLTEFSGNGVFHFQSRLRDLNLNSPVRVIASLISYRTNSELTRPPPLRWWPSQLYYIYTSFYLLCIIIFFFLFCTLFKQDKKLRYKKIHNGKVITHNK